MASTIIIPPGVPTKYDNTWGAALIGAFVAAVLYGMLIVQIYLLFRRSKDDMPLLRNSVWILLFLNTIHLICIIHSLYIFMVTNFLNPSVLIEKVPWSLPLVVLFNAAIEGLVQGWFIFRVYRLSDENKWLTTLLVVGGLFVLGNSTGITIQYFQLERFPEYPKANVTVFLGLGFTVATDLIIALALCYYLRQMRQGTVRQTTTMVNKLIVYAVNTGLLTSFLCAGCFVALILQPNNFIFIGLFFPLSSLYSNAFLGSLNARDCFRRSGTLSLSLGSLSSRSAGNNHPCSLVFRRGADTCTEDRSTRSDGLELAVQVETDVIKTMDDALVAKPPQAAGIEYER